MKISALNVNTDVIVTLEDITGPYRLERKVGDGGWMVWDGTAFTSGATPASLTNKKFSDYTLSDGFYQYRAAVIEETLSYVCSEWVKIGLSGEKVGWYYRNYVPPEGSFGEILTPDDMRYHFLWGTDFKATNGDSFSDDEIKSEIESSVAEIERCLNIKLNKTKVLCEPDSNKILGTDYDEEEAAYTYRHDRWHTYGRIVLRKRPIISVERFGLYTITDQQVIDLIPWMRLDKHNGVITFYPRAGANGTMRVSSPVLLIHSYSSGDYPGGYKIDYTCGYENSSLIPADLRGIIGKIAACKLLNIIGDGLISGFSSSSLSMDGVSESFSSTQSATSAYFGARIEVYLKDIKSYLTQNKNKFGAQLIGSI